MHALKASLLVFAGLRVKGQYCLFIFLKQASLCHRLVHTWFLKIDLVQTTVYVHVCVCVPHPTRLLIPSGVTLRDMDST